MLLIVTVSIAYVATPSAPNQRAKTTPVSIVAAAAATFAKSVRTTLLEKLASWLMSVDPVLIPKAEIQERPQLKTPVAASAVMLVEHLLDEPVIEKAAFADR